MKRRTLLQGAAVGGAFYLGNALGFSSSETETTMVRSLVPVFDRLPQILATHAGLPLAAATPDQLAMASSATFDSTAIGRGVWPLVIGLGKTAGRIVDQIPAQFPELFPELFGFHHLKDGAGDLGLYRTGLVGGTITAPGLDLRLARCSGAVLLLDATDPRARAEATHWAGVLAAAGVYLRVLVVLNASGIRHDDPWRAGLQAPIIEVQQGANTLDQTGIVLALLPGLLMLQSNSSHDFGNTQWPLTTTRFAHTTAVRWTPPDDPGPAIANAYAAVSLHGCRYAHIWVNAPENDGLYRVYYDPRDAKYWIYVQTIYEGPNDGFKMFLWHGDQNDQPTLAVTSDLGDRWVPYIPDEGFKGWFVTQEQAFLADQPGNTFDPEPMREAADAMPHWTRCWLDRAEIPAVRAPLPNLPDSLSPWGAIA